MAMVNADSSCLTVQVGWLGLRVGGQPAVSIHSSNEPGELSQWLCHDDSTINIISVIIIIIITIHLRVSDTRVNDARASHCLSTAYISRQSPLRLKRIHYILA